MMKINDIQDNYEKMVTTDRNSTMLICIHGKNSEEPYGEILNCYIENPMPFTSLGDMILKLDEMCNWIGTPYPSAEPRFLNKKMKEQYLRRMEKKNKVSMKAKIRILERSLLLSRAVKARETLVVTIDFRQFANFQGRIQGKMTHGKIISFRSSLELMYMIRESLTDV